MICCMNQNFQPAKACSRARFFIVHYLCESAVTQCPSEDARDPSVSFVLFVLMQSGALFLQVA